MTIHNTCASWQTHHKVMADLARTRALLKEACTSMEWCSSQTFCDHSDIQRRARANLAAATPAADSAGESST